MLKSSVQLFGFVFLLLGNFTYNEVVEWKCFGMNKNMRKYLNHQPTEEEEEIQNIVSLGNSNDVGKRFDEGDDE